MTRDKLFGAKNELSVDILIVTYRDKDKLQECVESIEKFTDYPHGILVDDNSPPNPNLGFGKANNLLLLKSYADYVMVLNADTKVTRDWLSPLLKEMENHSVKDPSMGSMNDRKVCQQMGRQGHKSKSLVN